MKVYVIEEENCGFEGLVAETAELAMKHVDELVKAVDAIHERNWGLGIFRKSKKFVPVKLTWGKWANDAWRGVSNPDAYRRVVFYVIEAEVISND